MIGHIAIHEAAHAVVAVRIGLPLEYVEARPGVHHHPGERQPTRYLGCTFVPPEGQTYHDMATLHAAGVVAQRLRGLPPGNDLELLVELAVDLQIGVSAEDPALRSWINQRVNEAHWLLTSDGQVGWRKVAAALRKRGTLTGADVRKILDSIPDPA